MNKVVLIGNLTRDPELTTTGTGISVCKFGLAVNRNFTNSQGERDVDFFTITAWRALAENCGKFLLKGSKVAVSGRIETRTFDKDGVRQYFTDIVADDVMFLSPKNHTGQEGGGEYAPKAVPAKKPTDTLTPVEDDGLPF